MPWQWDARSRRYRDDRGKYASHATIRTAVDAVLDAAERDADRLADRLIAGRISLATWQEGMEILLKAAHVAVGGIGAGGHVNATAADWGTVGAKLRFQYGKLREFAEEIGDGLTLDGSFKARARMYANSAVGSYEAVLRRGIVTSGYTEERRVLYSGKPCPECEFFASQGWVEKGNLPDIGQQCSCLSNCRCRFEYRGLPKMARNPALADMGYDAAKCARRRRVASLRDKVDGLPVSMGGFGAPALPEGASLIRALGKLAITKADAVRRINAIRKGGEPLAEDDLLLHDLEAGNTNFARSHSLFLGSSTLKAVQAQAEAGFALMNSHRTGGLSSPAELPYGRVFAGRWEKMTLGDGKPFERVILQAYMRRGMFPAGKGGPSTDDMSASIDAGTIFDVSLGLGGGRATCDVCGHDLSEAGPDDMPLCPHIHGTKLAMDDDAVAAAEARGTAGVASFTLHDARPREVSAVYDGAVPGAGFRHALTVARSGGVPRSALSVAMGAFPGVALSSDFGHRSKTMSMFSKFLKRAQAADTPDEIADLAAEMEKALAASPAPTAAPVGNSPLAADLKAKDAELDALRKRLEAQDRAFAAQDKAAGDAFGESLVTRLRIEPTDLQTKASALMVALRTIDRAGTLDFSAADTLSMLFNAVKPPASNGQKLSAEDFRNLRIAHKGAADSDDLEADLDYLSGKAAAGRRA